MDALRLLSKASGKPGTSMRMQLRLEVLERDQKKKTSLIISNSIDPHWGHKLTQPMDVPTF